MSEQADYLTRHIVWRGTGTRVFVYAARVAHAWWVLRLNEFPDHPLYTLFVDGARVGDVQDIASNAPGWDLDTARRPRLTSAELGEVLALMRGLGPYGAEIGQPCDGDWCGCERFTDDYIRASRRSES